MPWTVWGPLSMGFSRQEHWSGLPCPSPGDLPNPGIEPMLPALQADSSPFEPAGKPLRRGLRYGEKQHLSAPTPCFDITKCSGLWGSWERACSSVLHIKAVLWKGRDPAKAVAPRQGLASPDGGFQVYPRGTWMTSSFGFFPQPRSSHLQARSSCGGCIMTAGRQPAQPHHWTPSCWASRTKAALHTGDLGIRGPPRGADATLHQTLIRGLRPTLRYLNSIKVKLIALIIMDCHPEHAVLGRENVYWFLTLCPALCWVPFIYQLI